MTTKLVWQPTAWKQIWQHHATTLTSPARLQTSFLGYSTAPPPPYLPSFFATSTSRSFYSLSSTFKAKASPRYVLSRSFASGLLAFSVPLKASETAAVVSSCSGGSSSIDRTLSSANGRKVREWRRSSKLHPFASLIWRRGICSDCRNAGLSKSTQRSASSKSGSKGNGNGNGRHKKEKHNGEKEGFALKNSRTSTPQKAEAGKVTGSNMEGATREAESRRKREDDDDDDKPRNKEDKDEQPKSLAAAAAAIAKRAARDHGFMDRLPQIHRPSVQELLAAASSRWDRIRIRFKWLTIRQIRPFTWDELTAFFSWIVLGNLAWIIFGTTAFFSITIWLVNTVFAQEYLAKIVGNYLTQNLGMKVVFESAIVPKWKDGSISFKNVFLSRRPGISKGKNVEKGSPEVAAAAAAAAAVADSQSDSDDEEEDDGNYTQFDLTLDTVNVTISLAKWMNGRGLLVDVDIKGVRGVVDRTHVHFDPKIDPRSFKHEHNPGDFELDSLKLEDLLVTVHQPGEFRPFHVSIFSCDLPQLRKRYLFYDFLCASHVSGSFDDSLFTLHPRQHHGQHHTNGHPALQDADDYPWKRTSRFRIDGLKVDHMNRGAAGPLNWIVSGNLDIIADIHFPEDSSEGITKFMHDVVEKMEASIATKRQQLTNLMSNQDMSYDNLSLSGIIGAAVGLTEDDDPVTNTLAIEDDGNYTTVIMHEEDTLPTFEKAALEPHKQDSEETTPTPESSPPQSQLTDPKTSKTFADQTSDDRKFIMIDLHLQLNDTRAAIPFFSHDLSYRNSALVRPIVAYINSHSTIVPINCRLLKRVKEFDGSWTLFDSGLMNDLSAEVYDAFIKDIADADIKRRRMRAVGLWSLQVFMNAFLAAMAGTIIA